MFDHSSLQTSIIRENKDNWALLSYFDISVEGTLWPAQKLGEGNKMAKNT